MNRWEPCAAWVAEPLISFQPFASKSFGFFQGFFRDSSEILLRFFWDSFRILLGFFEFGCFEISGEILSVLMGGRGRERRRRRVSWGPCHAIYRQDYQKYFSGAPDHSISILSSFRAIPDRFQSNISATVEQIPRHLPTGLSKTFLRCSWSFDIHSEQFQSSSRSVSEQYWSHSRADAAPSTVKILQKFLPKLQSNYRAITEQLSSNSRANPEQVPSRSCAT